MKTPERIETDRLVIVPVDMKYAPDIFREFTLEITKYMRPPSPKEIIETETYIKSSIEKRLAGTDFAGIILDKQTGEFIGGSGLHHLDTKTPEFGIWLKKSVHGNKYGQEAILGLKKWADENLDYEYMSYPVAVENVASRKIPELMGGVIDHEYTDHNGLGEEQKLVEYRIYRKTE